MQHLRPVTCHNSHKLFTVAVLTGMMVLLATPVWAQTPTVQDKPRTTTTNSVSVFGNAIPSAFSSTDWSALTPEQQHALKPLSATWNHLSTLQKRKWLSLGTNFSNMALADQNKLHGRMAQWAALSPRQREQARLNFAEAKKMMPPQQKNEKWIAYQALSPEDKKKLAKSAQSKPPHTALAAQPSAPDKLSHLPSRKMIKPPVLPVVRPQPPTPARLAASVAASAVPAPLSPPVLPAGPSP